MKTKAKPEIAIEMDIRTAQLIEDSALFEERLPINPEIWEQIFGSAAEFGAYMADRNRVKDPVEFDRIWDAKEKGK